MEMTFGFLKRGWVGQVTLNGVTEVTLNVPNLEANSIVLAILNTAGGTVAPHYISSKTVGAAGTAGVVGFKSSAGNTSVIDVFVYQ